MDFKEVAKQAISNALSGLKKKLILIGVCVLAVFLLLSLIVGLIIGIFESENEEGTYNGLTSYSFWWPIGSLEVTTDENGNQFAVGEPSSINISSDYKDRNPERPDHDGIDISSYDLEGIRQGKGYHYIIASKDGEVIVSHLSDTAGEYVAIDHGDGFVTKYMHMFEESRTVEVGDIVKQGQILGLMGNTGNVDKSVSDGTHLHFQMELNGVPVDPLQYTTPENSRGVDVSPFATSLSKEEFVSCVQQYSQDADYQTYMVPYAEDFYDICVQYGVNPEFAFAHSCLETSYGSSNMVKEKRNYFGYGAYNIDPSLATTYNDAESSIIGYCNWVIDNSTLETSAYQETVEWAEKLSTCNSTLVGTPETNIYVLFSRYAQLDETHEGNYGDISFVKENGTYYFTYYMYGEMCTCTPGSETTLQEHADYAVYTTNERLNILQNIFRK